MQDYNNMIESFKTLDYEWKKVRLISLLEVFKDYSESTSDLLEYTKDDDLNDDDMIDVYTSMVKNIQKINEEKMSTSMTKIEKLSNKLKQLHIEEESERKNENPDDLLNQI